MTDLSTLLAELDAAVAKMTTGKMFPIRVADATTPEAMLEAMRISIEASPGTEMFGININGNPDTVELGPDEKCIAYTGNGPTSEANAIGIVALVNAYPAVKEGIEQLTHERDEALAEGLEQARLLGASGSREARLLAVIEQQRGALRDLLADLDTRAEIKAMITGAAEVVVDASAGILEKARAVLAAEVPRG